MMFPKEPVGTGLVMNPIKSDLENRFIPDRSKVDTVKNKD